MKIYAFIGLIFFALCGCGRDVEYDLDENTFKADTVAEIREASGIYIPDRARGLKYHYVPPIDPIVFAKIGIPAEEGKLVEASIGQLKDMPNFGEDFANDRCPWWPSKIENPIISKKAFNGDYYIEAYLIQENDGLILYLKYFTV